MKKVAIIGAGPAGIEAAAALAKMGVSRKVAHYLINTLEVKKGEKLAILSESKPEYGACVFASVLAGMVTVPLDIKLTEYELESLLSDCCCCFP